MKTAITTLSFIALMGFGTAPWAAEDPSKASFAGIPGVEGKRLNEGTESRSELQRALTTVSENAAIPQPPKERKVRIVYPLPR